MSLKKPPEPLRGAPLGLPGKPGSYPFIRGIHPNMYRGKIWTMRQYAGFGNAQQANQRFLYLRSQGQSGLSVAFDLPTQLGLDSDDIKARGEVGRVGVAIANSGNMQTLFANIKLSDVSTSMTINATAPMLLAFYINLAKSQGVTWEQLRGTVQNDILKEFIARGNYIFPPTASLRLVVDLIEFCQQQLPKWYPISISGYHIREAGATAVQELAFTFANALTYVRACQARQLNLDDILQRLTFFFSVDNDFIEEIAKFRAARQLWAELLTRYFGIAKTATPQLQLRFHAQTGGSTLTAKQPHNNITRVTLQALAAVLGGAQSLHTNAWDEALALPTEASARLALRTQQIIAEESGVINCVDPCGGAYAVEEKTQYLFTQAMQWIEQVDQMGGSIAAIQQGYFQQAIADSAYAQQKAIEQHSKIVVGINRYQQADDKTSTPLWSLDAKSEQQQCRQLKQWRSERSHAMVKRALTALQQQAKGEMNLMPAIVEAAAQGATLGEMNQVLQQSFGIYQERISL